MLSEEELLRYSCQIRLPGFGLEKQQLLQNARVLIVGAGGLGCPAAQYLAAAGVGTITLADFDTVSVSNLHRQILYTPLDTGMKKAEAASRKLQEQNPGIQILPFTNKITVDNVMSIVSVHDVIMDCSDNFETRYLINDACVLSGKPLVYGAIYQYEGQLAVFNMLNEDGTRMPNYRDVFPEADAAMIPDCEEGGVISPLAGIIGCMQANEAIKVITNTGLPLSGKLLLFDAQTMQSRTISIGNVSKTEITEIRNSVLVPLISPEELSAGMSRGEFELIDVRSKEERRIFDIGGHHVPLEELELRIKSIPAQRPVVFYCASGRRSAEAVKIFLRNFADAAVFSLQGGTKQWKEKMLAAGLS